MKKFLKFSIIVIIIITFFVTVLYFSSIFLSHFNVLKTTDQLAEHYSNYSIENNGFVLKTKVIESDNMKFIVFTVYSYDKNNIIFDSYNDKEQYIWRLSDFKSIEFAKDSLDIIVESGDMGTSHFRFDKNYWYLEE